MELPVVYCNLTRTCLTVYVRAQGRHPAGNHLAADYNCNGRPHHRWEWQGVQRNDQEPPLRQMNIHGMETTQMHFTGKVKANSTCWGDSGHVWLCCGISHFLWTSLLGQQHHGCWQEKTWSTDQEDQLCLGMRPQLSAGGRWKRGDSLVIILLCWRMTPTLCRAPWEHWRAPTVTGCFTLSVWKSNIAGPSFLLLSECTARLAPSRPHTHTDTDC